MIIKSAVLDIVCGITSKIPDTGLPEVHLQDKSNVGKSSLINWTDEQESTGTYQRTAWQNADDQFLQDQ